MVLQAGPCGDSGPGAGEGGWGRQSVIRTDGEAGPALSPSPGSRCSLPPTAFTFPQCHQSALKAGCTGVGGRDLSGGLVCHETHVWSLFSGYL